MNKTINYADFATLGIKNELVRYIWVAWTILVILSSLLGDTIILLATIRYKAIRLQKVTVVFMQHIASCDILLTVTYITPGLVSLLADGWVLGDFICNVTTYSSYYGLPVGCFLIGGMTTGKLLMLHFPLKARIWTCTQTHKVCGVIWVFCLGLPITQFLVSSTDVVFDLRKYNCSYGFFAGTWKWLKPTSFVLMGSVPSIAIIVSTVLLFRKAMKITHTTLRWQGSLTLVLVATMYSFAILPYNIYGLVEPFLEKDPVKWSMFQLVFYRCACTMLSINVMSNFFIYSLTVRSFRKFLGEKGRLMLQLVSGK